MAWVDSCCLQLAVKNKSNKEEIYTFQTDNPAVKKEWITGNEFVCSVLWSKYCYSWKEIIYC